MMKESFFENNNVKSENICEGLLWFTYKYFNQIIYILVFDQHLDNKKIRQRHLFYFIFLNTVIPRKKIIDNFVWHRNYVPKIDKGYKQI